MEDVTVYSTATRLFLDLMDVYERNGVHIPRKDQPLVRTALVELIRIVGNHYDRTDQ